jgi:PKD repeat protein
MKSAACSLHASCLLLARVFLAAVIASCFFAFSASRAQAAFLSEPQIQAIVGILSSFGVDQATISNVNNILHGNSKDTGSSVPPVSTSGEPYIFVNAQSGGFSYAYGPSIIKVGDTWHMYFCSTGDGTSAAWDYVRHETSVDGIHWSAPDLILQVSDPVNERATCDPSVVYYNAGDGDYYYLFYSGNKKDVQTVNFVARSASPTGPFLKYTSRGTWEQNAADPKPIILPMHATPDGSGAWYGAGQPTVVVKDGKLYQWYTDTTSQYPTTQTNKIFLTISSNPTVWPQPTPTNVDDASVDVKYNPATGKFIMYSASYAQNSAIYTRESADGITWSSPQVAIDETRAANFIQNPGVSGSRTGEFLPNAVIVGYGAPYNPNATADTWGKWNLWGHASISTTTSVQTTFTASPVSGTSPLMVQFTSQGSPLYTHVDFGDGSVGDLYPAPTCDTCTPSATGIHTYASAGTYTAKLYNGTSVVGMATVKVSTSQSISFTASPTSGSAPLAVNFSVNGLASGATYMVDFGDSASTVLNPMCTDSGCVVSHMYSNVGTYIALLKKRTGMTGSIQPNAIYETVGTATVTVSAPVVTTSFTASPASGNSPLAVSFAASGLNAASTYYINYGDGSTLDSLVLAPPPCAQGVDCSNSYTGRATHTYTQVGTFSVTLNKVPDCPVSIACPASIVPVGSATVTVHAATPTGSNGAFIDPLMMVAAAPFRLAVDSLINIFFALGIGR